LDDVILLPVLIWLAMKLCPQHVLEDSQQKADDWRAQQRQRPISVVGLVGIVLIWLGVATVLGLWLHHHLVAPTINAR
jgi:hypothetical protein